MKSSPTGRVALLLFGSGLCALVYQIAWLRELRLVFGASTAASAAVLGIFMGGLGAGGLVFGKRAAAAARPLLLYARLEAGIAVASALTPLFVVVARWLYAAVGGTPALGLGGGTVARLVLAAVVLAVPTLLMGGTLPAAAQAVTRTGDVGRRDLRHPLRRQHARRRRRRDAVDVRAARGARHAPHALRRLRAQPRRRGRRGAARRRA